VAQHGTAWRKVPAEWEAPFRDGSTDEPLVDYQQPLAGLQWLSNSEMDAEDE